jgi:hypothetical protein
MALRAWLTGSARTALRDARLFWSEWQWLMDYLEEQRGLLGDLTTTGGGSITDAINGVTSAQSQAFSALAMNLRIETDETDPDHVVRVRADGLGIEDAYVTNLDKLVDLDASGLLGLDTGSKSIDTWYFLWVGFDPDTENTTAIFSESFTAGGLTLSGPLTPYTKWRRIGARRNNHIGDLIPGTQQGVRMLYDARRDQQFDHATTPGLGVGGLGSATTLTAIDLSPLVPPTSLIADVLAHVQGASIDGGVDLYPGNTTLDGSTSGPLNIGVAASPDRAIVRHLIATDDDQQIYYKVDAASGADLILSIAGYEDA